MEEVEPVAESDERRAERYPNQRFMGRDAVITMNAGKLAVQQVRIKRETDLAETVQETQDIGLIAGLALAHHVGVKPDPHVFAVSRCT